MARKKTADATDAPPPEPTQEAPHELPATEPTTSPSEAPAGEVSLNGEKKRPAYKIGPIPTGKGESVAGCVWENEHEAGGRTYVVHSIVLDVSYFSEKEGKWLPSRGIRPSQLAVVEYVLRQCGDFAFRRRDPQSDCPF